jgi:hypothetical protein
VAGDAAAEECGPGVARSGDEDSDGAVGQRLSTDLHRWDRLRRRGLEVGTGSSPPLACSGAGSSERGIKSLQSI